MLSVGQLFAGDMADGSLEQMLLAPASAVAVAAAKCSAHWLLTGLPLIIATPLAGLVFNLSAPGAAGTGGQPGAGHAPSSACWAGWVRRSRWGLRSGGMLLILVVLPLATPALIFGAGAVGMVESGLSASGHFSLLGALLIVTALGAPVATAAALRISTD